MQGIAAVKSAAVATGKNAAGTADEAGHAGTALGMTRAILPGPSSCGVPYRNFHSCANPDRPLHLSPKSKCFFRSAFTTHQGAHDIPATLGAAIVEELALVHPPAAACGAGSTRRKARARLAVTLVLPYISWLVDHKVTADRIPAQLQAVAWRCAASCHQVPSAHLAAHHWWCLLGRCCHTWCPPAGWSQRQQ